jgi:transposase
MSEQKKQRQHSVEFRTSIAERMLAGEGVVALSRQYQLPRSMMYRWRDAYRQSGPAALSKLQGRPRGPAAAAKTVARGGNEERLRGRIAELERKVGQQTVQIDFFKAVFRRLEELPKTPARGGTASTRKSGE